MRILHMLNWNLNDIVDELGEIYDQGFDAIQINPVQPLKEDHSGKWWMSYQPCGFSIGNEYGSKYDLMRLCLLAGEYNIKIIADVICNHTAGQNDGALVPNEKVDDELRSHPEYWKENKTIYNWDDRYEVTHYCMGLPGLNVNNEKLQQIMINFLDELIDCGVGGFRFDAAKNIALPEEGCTFWPNIMEHLQGKDVYCYGEIIFASRELMKAYSKYVDILTNCADSCEDKEHVVAFVENHDSYLEFGYSKNKTGDEINEWYYSLSEWYRNTIYYARPFDDTWKKERVREANQINSKQRVRMYLQKQ